MTLVRVLCEAEELIEVPAPVEAVGSTYREGVEGAAGTEVTGPVEVVFVFEGLVVEHYVILRKFVIIMNQIQ